LSDEPQKGDPQGAEIASKLNWLRAAVLGANDGIVSTAAVIFGVAGGSSAHGAVVLAGIAAIAAGALSMAVGEYVSVSSQRDVEKAEIKRERRQIETHPKEELQQLTALLEGRGIDRDLAEKVAVQLHERDALAAHARVELGIDPEAVVSPLNAALASLAAFTVGGLIPLLSIVLAPAAIAIWVAGAAVLLALALSGWISAWLGRTPRFRSVARAVAGGVLAMAITYGIGKLAGTQV
jgi:VIT1/CCC1 family predicted Fe2+/Mn2+ transporter